MPEPQPDEPHADDSVHLIYKIEGEPDEVDVFELSRVLDGFGNVLCESYHIAHPTEGEMVVKVKPFEEGSFIMDISLHIQQNAALLFFLTNPEVIKYAKETLECLGFIQKVTEKGASLLELLKKLKNGKPKKIVQKGPDEYDFHAGDGAVIPVNSTVNALYNSPVINNYTINIIAPAERENVQGISTYLKNALEATKVTIDKEDAKAVRAYSDPAEEIPTPEILEYTTTKILNPKIDKEDAKAVRAYSDPAEEIPTREILEDTTTKILNPKSGNYRQTTGTWAFTIAGTKRAIKAKITAKDFPTGYSAGSITFYQGDRLKVRLHEKQITEGVNTKMEYEIRDVLEYHPAQPPVMRPS